MLQSIRERASGWIAWVVFILISIPFALWGVHEYLGTDVDPSVATIGDAKINLNEFQRAYQLERQRIRTALGASFADAEIDDVRLRGEVLERLIRDEVLVQTAIKDGMRIGDPLLANAIRLQEAFQMQGVFSQPAYETWLRSQGLTSTGFESRLRRSLLAEQVTAGVGQTALAPEQSAARRGMIERQTRHLSILTVPIANFITEKSEFSDEEVRRFYERRGSELMSPEQVSLDYVVLSKDDIASGLSVTDEELRQSYDARGSALMTPEQRRVRHILIELPPQASAEEEAMARQTLETLRQRLISGDSFAELAAMASQDPGSASQGGDLGYFARGIMDSRFEAVAFELPEGVPSEPVRTGFGFHLIEVTDIKAGGTRSFDEMRNELEADLRRERAEQLFFEQVELLATLAFEHPDSLSTAAEALGIEVKEASNVSRETESIDPVLLDRKVLDIAFSTELTEGGLNSEPIDVGEGRVLLLRVREHRQATRRSLEEARGDIVGLLRLEVATKELTGAVTVLLERLRGGDAPEVVASDSGLKWNAFDAVPRSGYVDGLSEEVRQVAFKIPRPLPNSMTFDATVVAEGNFAILGLRGVQQPVLDEDANRILSQIVALEHGQEEFGAYLESLRASANVRIPNDALSNAR